MGARVAPPRAAPIAISPVSARADHDPRGDVVRDRASDHPIRVTGEYGIILPLMLAVAMAAGTSQLISKDTIYTRKLLRRGIDIDKTADRDPFAGQRIAGAVGPAPDPLPAATELSAAAQLLANSEWSMLPVVDADSGIYRGCVSARGLTEALQIPTAHEITVEQITELPAAVTSASSVEDALTAMIDHAGTGLPVLDEDHDHVVGWISHHNLLTAIRTASQVAMDRR